MLKTLYLYGLNSFLNEEKRTVLEKFSVVTAPGIYYASQPKVFNNLLEIVGEKRFNIIIGTSMGGFLGYIFSLASGLPALLLIRLFLTKVSH